ncbi:MAG: hypothetical protein HUN04_08465 [Desulfobacter sp.]|nr:MAG: hypothetical protein HUN04_08465 [Desulfobacter sp.]
MNPVRDPDVFLSMCDAVIAMGRDDGTLRLKDRARRVSPDIKWVELLDPEDPLSVLRFDLPYTFFYLHYQNINTIENQFRHSGIDTRIILDQKYHSGEKLDPFSHAILKTGKAHYNCPFCGKPLQTRHSFVVHGETPIQTAVFFRFNCCDEFYVLSHSFYSTMALYFPGREIIMALYSLSGVKPEKNFWYPLAALVNAFKEAAFIYRDEVDAYLNSEPGKVRCIVQAMRGNISIEFWQYNAARVCAEGSSLIKEMQVIDSPKIGFVQSCLADTGIQVSKVFGMDEKRLRIQPFLDSIQGDAVSMLAISGAPIRKEVGEAWVAYCRQEIPYRSHCEMEAVKGCSPLMVITIRADYSRNWVGQGNGLAYLVNGVAERFPGAGVVFDGIRPQHGKDAYDEMCRRIEEKISGNVPVFWALDRPLNDTIAWFSHGDLYIGPCSGGVIFSLIADMPKLIYGPKEFLKDSVEEKNGRTLIQGMRWDASPIRLVEAVDETLCDQSFMTYELDCDELLANAIDMLEAAR